MKGTPPVMTDAQDAPPSTGPYAAAAATYWAAGWRGVLPLPPRRKGPVPTGWTGTDGAWPSYADIHAWTEDHPDGNLALRLPPGVIGIDVDQYGGKPGYLVLQSLEAKLCALPATWRSTSRDDGMSGIRLYRIPEGLRWPGVLGPGIEVLRTGHRYAVAWPSIHPDTGGTYRWITPDGATALEVVPSVDDLPDLPDAWVEHFTHGELATEQPRANLSTGAAGQWLTERGGGTTCAHMRTAATRAAIDIADASSRHDTTLAATNRIVWLAGEGHTGAGAELRDLRALFLKVTAGARDGLESEWDRMVAGAVRIAAAAHPDINPDPCDDPFHGLIPKGDNPWKISQTAHSQSASLASPTPLSASPTSSTSQPQNSDASKHSLELGPQPSDAPERERTTWWPRNIQAAITGEGPEETPTFLTRDDGHALFYPGRVNGIIGPSESGKTWIALEAVKQAVAAGERVTILDFEDSDRGVIGRLMSLGMPGETVHEWVRYINPDEPFSQLMPSGLDLLEHLDSWQPALIVLDGFNAAMTLQGLDLMSNRDATVFSQLVLRPLTRNDACVVYIDHVPKSKDNTAAGGIGAQAKRAMTTGCTLKVDPVKLFGKGQDGRLRVYVDKDRPGHVRGVSAPANGTHWAADVTITTGADEQISLAILKPEGLDTATHRYEFRPTGYMERISQWLEDNPGAGRNDIIREVSGDSNHKKTALKVLIGEGWVVVAKDGQKHLHSVATPFNELVSPPQNQPGLTGVGPGLATPVKGPGLLGLTGGTTYPVPSPGSTSETTLPRVERAPTPVGRVVERVVAGERVKLNLDTGEMEPA